MAKKPKVAKATDDILQEWLLRGARLKQPAEGSASGIKPPQSTEPRKNPINVPPGIVGHTSSALFSSSSASSPTIPSQPDQVKKNEEQEPKPTDETTNAPSK